MAGQTSAQMINIPQFHHDKFVLCKHKQCHYGMYNIDADITDNI